MIRMRKVFEVIFSSACFAIAAFIWVGILAENRMFPIGIGGFISALLIGIGLLPVLIKRKKKSKPSTVSEPTILRKPRNRSEPSVVRNPTRESEPTPERKPTTTSEGGNHGS